MAEKKKLKNGKQKHVWISEDLNLRVEQYKERERMGSWCEAFRTLLAIALADHADRETIDLTPKEQIFSGTVSE